MTSQLTVAGQLDRIQRLDQDKPRKTITILGAGMAGLTAAYELRRLGHSVKILEAMNRAGGRVWTWRSPNHEGQYHELGAMRVPSGHDFTRHYIDVAGLRPALCKFVTAHENMRCFYDLRGHVSRMSDMAANILPHYGLSDAERGQALGSVPPAILGEHLHRTIQGLTEHDLRGCMDDSCLSDTVCALESQSLGEFIDANLDTADAKELIGATTGLEVWWDKALSMFIRDEIVGVGKGLQQIAGGMDQLPDALAKFFGNGEIEYNTAIVGIELKDGSIALRTRATDPDVWDCPIADTPARERLCDHVICTIPFGVLRTLSLDGFSSRKMGAIRNLSYASSTKVLLDCRTRIWEQGAPHERILGGATLSDQITRATYYPCDHATTQEDDPDTGASGYRNLYTTFATEDLEAGADTDTEHNPGVLLGSYSWGQDARRMGSLSLDERGATVARVLERLHPGLEEVVDDVASMYWDEFRWSRGAFCFMQPGDRIHYQSAATMSEGNLHFAGEHCSLDQGWIQGAVKSALNVVEDLVARP